MIVGTEVPTFVRGLTAVVEDLHVDDGVGDDGGPPPPAPPLAVVVPLPQLPRPRRRRLLTARVRRPSGRVQVQGAAFAGHSGYNGLLNLNSSGDITGIQHRTRLVV